MASDPFARLLERMLPFHNHFRMEYANIVRGIPQSQQSPKFSLMTLMRQSLQLCQHLEMHHSIEEAHIFPLLASKVPSFGRDSAHTEEHKLMHAKLEELERYSKKVVRDLQSSEGKRAEANGAGLLIKKDEEASSSDEETSLTGRKPWPTSVYDEQTFDDLVKGVASALFPHLEAEETSLKPENLKKHGLTLQDLARIPM